MRLRGEHVIGSGLELEGELIQLSAFTSETAAGVHSAGSRVRARDADRDSMSSDYDPRTFIESVEWRFAKTMAHYNPHWYVVERDHRGKAIDDFVAFVRSGPIRRYSGGRYHCVTVDEWDYFLTHAGSDGWIVNRKPSPEAGWDPSPPPTLTRAS